MRIVGSGIMEGNCLRCAAPRRNGICHKLLAIRNTDGKLLGLFCCVRCNNKVEVLEK
jgi:hypothetical protein